ncbi:heme biosynthesis protein [Hahella sp. CCB-MM4]|uniref:uroporphyrinogen-III C-methyltransferase n=1 Tax=Hahella sp. (strain CCB-MM4) TaxID=1926491 RepID=UPI000B9C0B22|nr:uroporphyrinogen-III C-methyltransferase [Hahella sp. CCB-MM4]OZG74639.1 heme biosynthesis protein [Hahella sp. CCB-MM4]
MTEETPNPTLPATTPAETETTPVSPPPSSASQSAPPVRAPRVWPLWLGMLVLLVALVLACGWFWMQLQSWNNKVDLAMEQSQSGTTMMNQVSQRYETKFSQLDSSLQRQTSQLEEVRNQLDQTARRILTVGETGRTDWLLAEAEYLLRLGNQRLHMERDYVGSLAILQAADQVLAETKEAAVFPVRKALASEIVSLEAVADVDRQGIYLKLEALIEQIEGLDQRLFFQDAPLLTETATEADREEEEGTWYDRALNSVKKLDRYFAIRFPEDPVKPLMAPDQIYYLRQNLRLMLEQAELALLDKNQAVYDQSLRKAETWIENYFITNSPVTKAILKNVQELKGHNIDPKLPDITESLHLLKNLLETVYKRSASDAQSFMTPQSTGDGAAS